MADYHDIGNRQRAAYVAKQQASRAEALRDKAAGLRRKALRAQGSALVARLLRLDPRLAAAYRTQVDGLRLAADRSDTEARATTDGRRPIAVDNPSDWHRLNHDAGSLASGPVGDDDVSALTGRDHPPSVDRTRRYDERGGLRRPLAEHQIDLERAMPRDNRGRPLRGADPRAPYFSKVNDGGPAADPTRGVNCQDCVLSFYETYVHGRPRVSAPRTFDSFVGPSVLGGETIGPERADNVTGGRFQNLAPTVSGIDPVADQRQIHQALAEVEAQLLTGGPGSFAFLINSWEGGAAHAWAAVNQGGQVLYVDPQSGLTRPPGTRLYDHLGHRSDGNITAIDALVVDGRGRPMTFANRSDGIWRPQQQTLPPIDFSSTSQSFPLPAPPIEFTVPPSPGPAVETSGPTVEIALDATFPDPVPADVREPAPPFTDGSLTDPAPDLGPDTPPDFDTDPHTGPATQFDFAPDSSPEPGPWTNGVGPASDLDRRPHLDPLSVLDPLRLADPLSVLDPSFRPAPRVDPAPDLISTDDPDSAPDLSPADPAPAFHHEPELASAGADPSIPPAPVQQPDPPAHPDPTPPHPSPIPALRRPTDRIAAALDPKPAPRSDLDRITDALSPKPPRAPAPLPSDLRAGPPADRPAPRPFDRDHNAREAYFGYSAHARKSRENLRRDEHGDWLTESAERLRTMANELGDRAAAAHRDGAVVRAHRYARHARELSDEAADLDVRSTQVRAGWHAPERVEVDNPHWSRINDDVGDLAIGGVDTDDHSALTRHDVPPPIDRTRRYGVRGGLRAPLAVHQKDLERAVPRDADGRPKRLPDPREGTWFALANDGGPAMDPTRAINCLDGVLSLFDTYLHGRPRVSAPRTFDAYREGNTARPIGAEEAGLDRIRSTTGADFQGLCPDVSTADPHRARTAITIATTNLQTHLMNAGHGSFAFITSTAEDGPSHAWAATNQHGTILFLDPQTGRISENAPLYTHYGIRGTGNITSINALVVDSNGTPTPLPADQTGPPTSYTEAPTSAGDEPGQQSGTDDASTPSEQSRPAEETAARILEREAFESLSKPDQEGLRELEMVAK